MDAASRTGSGHAAWQSWSDRLSISLETVKPRTPWRITASLHHPLTADTTNQNLRKGHQILMFKTLFLLCVFAWLLQVATGAVQVLYACIQALAQNPLQRFRRLFTPMDHAPDLLQLGHVQCCPHSASTAYCMRRMPATEKTTPRNWSQVAQASIQSHKDTPGTGSWLWNPEILAVYNLQGANYSAHTKCKCWT